MNMNNTLYMIIFVDPW